MLPERCLPEEVAEYLRIDTRDVKKLCRKGRIKHMRPTPNKIIIWREDVEEYEKLCQKETMARISITEKTESNGKSGNLQGEGVSDTQLALEAAKMLKESLSESLPNKHRKNVYPLDKS